MESTPTANAEWVAWPPDLIGRCLELLNQNDMTFQGRLVNKDACRRFSDPLHRTATFGIPLPPEATETAWQHNMPQAFQQLTFVGKLRPLSVAAASGSQLNLELAWALLQPCMSLGFVQATIAEDAGTAAVRHGHLHLLPWLLQHGCPMDKHSVLEAAAQHCDLAGMQRAWGLLVGSNSRPPSGSEIQIKLAIAAGNSGSDAIAKLSWLLAVNKDLFQNPKLTEREMVMAAAQGAAASGNLPVLRWLLHEREPSMCSNTLAELWERDARRFRTWQGVLSSALSHGHVAVADWLVDEVGCPVLEQLQQQQQQQQQQLLLLEEKVQYVWDGAARSGSVESMRWLLGRGIGVCGSAITFAAASGRLEAVRFLHDDCGVTLQDGWPFRFAAGSGSVPLATWLLQAGCPMDKSAYGSAAGAGHGDMLRWLALEAGCPWDQETLRVVLGHFWWGAKGGRVGGKSADASQLEPAVRAMLEAGCPPGGGTDGADSIGAAARLGFLPLVRHLREERGVAFAPGTLAAAAGGGCVPVVEWLVGAGCRARELTVGGWDLLDPYVAAAGGQSGRGTGVADVATLSCLRRLGVPWRPSVLRQAVRWRVSLRVLRWMVEQGAPWDEGTLRDQVTDHWRRGDDEDVAWFAERLGMCGPGAGSGAVAPVGQ